MDTEMKEAVKRGDEELIPAGVSDTDLTDEMNFRSSKKGLTNRQGVCSSNTGKIMTTVPCGKEKLNIWPRDEQGNLIGE